MDEFANMYADKWFLPSAESQMVKKSLPTLSTFGGGGTAMFKICLFGGGGLKNNFDCLSY